MADSSVHSLAIGISFVALSVVLLMAPPLYWHCRNRNVGAAVLVIWAIYLNIQTFLNAIIWSSDDTQKWFDGKILCNIESKLEMASTIAIPAALFCILRTLARVMDTDRATAIMTISRKRRQMTLELCICLVPPCTNVVVHFVIQAQRYSVYGISGCVPTINVNWVSIAFLLAPPLVFMAFGAYYTILILVRLYRYRATFASVLQHSNTTKSRFMRLYILCLVFLVGVIPVQLYVFGSDVIAQDYSYNWAQAHEEASEIPFVPSNGVLVYDRYIWLAMGVLVFVFFGLGREAVAMYRNGLRRIGVDAAVAFINKRWTSFSKRHDKFASSDSSHSSARLCRSQDKSFAISTVETVTSGEDGSLTVSSSSEKDWQSTANADAIPTIVLSRPMVEIAASPKNKALPEVP